MIAEIQWNSSCVALAAIRASPDRNGKQHDVHGREAGNGKAGQQAAPAILRGAGRLGREFRGVESDCGKGIDQLRRVRRLPIAEYDGGALRRQVRPGGNHARNSGKRSLDLTHAAAANHVFDGERHGLLGGGERFGPKLGGAEPDCVQRADELRRIRVLGVANHDGGVLRGEICPGGDHTRNSGKRGLDLARAAAANHVFDSECHGLCG